MIKIPFLKCVIVPRSALPALEVVQFKLYFIFYIVTGTSGKCANGFGKTVIVRVLLNYPARLHCMRFTAPLFMLFWIRKAFK